MIRCLIVDDEEVARDHMARLLKAFPDVVEAGQAANGAEALELISSSKPDVVFLDIEMPELTAFDMLAELKEPPLIVFATAYDHYAVQAFESNAIDYLLKPIQAARLGACQMRPDMLAVAFTFWYALGSSHIAQST